MLHEMHLNTVSFFRAEKKNKTVEIRLNDEKRRKIQTGDLICFTELDYPENSMLVKVVALHHFDTFAALYKAIPQEKLGFSERDVVDPDDIYEIYTREQESEYGVLGIEFKMTNLLRFVKAQNAGVFEETTYQTALNEVRSGRKLSHWIWFIFPQHHALGKSPTSEYYGIADLEEAIDYYHHPLLGGRLVEISRALMNQECDNLYHIFGSIDAKKVRSCMTLFKYAAPDQPVFQEVLDRFCGGKEDPLTLKYLNL